MRDNLTVPAIEVKDLECRYGDRTILREVAFSVQAKEIFFIIGGSGCGKTTLLRHLIGLMLPAKGTIAYFGKSFIDCDFACRRSMLKGFGVLYQNSALWSSMTVAENIDLPLEEHTSLKKCEREEIVALKLAQVGLSGYENFFPAELSGGMKKRAALARALALDPTIVFFDEPAAGLDPVSARKLHELILEVRESLGTTMVIISHNLSSIFGIADRMIMLDGDAKGIIADGVPATLAETSTDERVRDFLARKMDVRKEKSVVVA